MTDIQQEVEQGPVNAERDPRRMALTMALLFVLALIAGGIGVGSTLVGQNRRNENLVPRLMEIYAIQPEGPLRYVAADRPADQILDDDDLPFEITERTLLGPAYTDSADLLTEEIGGGELASTTPQEGEGVLRSVYLVEREITDGQVVSLRVDVANSPNLSFEGDTATFTLAVNPQDTHAQRMIAVAVPAGAEVLSYDGPQAYRQVSFTGWQVTYFDVTTISQPRLITLQADLSGTRTPDDINLVQFELNR